MRALTFALLAVVAPATASAQLQLTSVDFAAERWREPFRVDFQESQAGRTPTVRQATLAAAFAGIGSRRAARADASGAVARPFQTAVDRQIVQRYRPRTATVVLGTVMGLTAGGVAGGYLGYQLDKDSGGEDPGLAGIIYGSVAGSAIGAPLGAKLMTGSEGDFALSFTGSLLGTVGALALGAASGEPLSGISVAPLLQLVAATAMIR